MNSNRLKKLNTSVLIKKNPALFSLAESESYYVIALDIPTLPGFDTEILKTRDEITVESQFDTSIEKQTVFRFLPKGNGVKTVYREGVLWLLLPKINVTSASQLEIAVG